MTIVEAVEFLDSGPALDLMVEGVAEAWGLVRGAVLAAQTGGEQGMPCVCGDSFGYVTITRCVSCGGVVDL